MSQHQKQQQRGLERLGGMERRRGGCRSHPVEGEGVKTCSADGDLECVDEDESDRRADGMS